MAPKLPPPARTKAVVLGPAWLDGDKASVAPVIGALVKKPAPFGHIYSSEFAEDATNKILRRPCPGCCAAAVRRCTASGTRDRTLRGLLWPRLKVQDGRWFILAKWCLASHAKPREISIGKARLLSGPVDLRGICLRRV